MECGAENNDVVTSIFVSRRGRGSGMTWEFQEGKD